MKQISVYEKSSSSDQIEEISVKDFLKRVKNGYWKKYQDKVRASSGEQRARLKRFSTPAVTLSGVFRKKRVGFPDVSSGVICIDCDGKDNKGLLKKRKDLEQDPYIFGLFTSIGGEGFALLFKVNPKKHYELFNGIQQYLFKEYKIVVDPGVKDPARLRYVSYDPDCFVDFSKESFVQAVVSVPTPTIIDDDHNIEDINILIKAIEKQQIDIVPRYHEWYIVGQALAKLGEHGRKFFNIISSFGEAYSKDECNLQFDNCLNQESQGRSDKKVSLGSLFFFAKEAGVKMPVPKVKNKKQDIKYEHSIKTLLSLQGFKLNRLIYTYHIWAFKVTFKKEGPTELECLGLNQEATSDFLFNLGIRRSGTTYYKVKDNIVEVITRDMILDILVQEGVKLPKDFSLLWDEESDTVSRKNIMNAVQTHGRRIVEKEIILKEFVPENEEFIKDEEDVCYLFFQNGVVCVSEDGYDLRPYSEMLGYIWKETIIQRDFKLVKKKSLIQTILENAIGKKHWDEVRSTLGYMLHNFTFGEGTEIVFCIDRSVGDLNEGGNGKDFFRQILSQIRKTVIIPGKSLNIQHQFSWERVDRDTQLVWIEDMGKHIKMEHLYNLNNGISVRRMHTQPFTVKCKVGISLQHLIDVEGSSDQRRQVFLLFSDFYSKAGGIGTFHKDRDIFGENWSGWEEFYVMIVDCVQYYLKTKIKRMDITELLDLRRQELSDGSFENLEQGTWYSTEAAIELCWGKDTIINTETFMLFRKKLSQWAKLSGLIVEAERKSIDKKQQKAIRLVAQMKMSGGKLTINR